MTIPTLPPIPRFVRPDGSDATEPPEHRGLTRDGVRMLLATPGRSEHRRFRDLPAVLTPGDLVVVNISATLPSAVPGLIRAPDGDQRAPVHVATSLDDGSWVVEVRRQDRRGPRFDLEPGTRIELPDGVEAQLLAPFPPPGALPARLWRARVRRPRSDGSEGPDPDLAAYLGRHGQPIVYDYLRRPFPLTDYQTVFARWPGSAEMPSAGRPFTEHLVVELVKRGVSLAPIVLHAGVSSPEVHEPPAPERYVVPPATARLVNAVREGGARVVAVGTTVVRALETCADADGAVRPGSGWTDLVLGSDRPARVVGGLVTGLHEPEASHLLLLDAVAGRDLVAQAYAAVTAPDAPRYLWHEFGDSMLLLP